MANLVKNAHLQKPFDEVYDKCSSTINEIRTTFNRQKEKVETEFQKLKEDVRKRGESLKNEIDDLCKKIFDDLDAQKNLILNKPFYPAPVYSNFLECQKEVEKIKNLKEINDMNENIKRMQEKLNYLNHLKRILDDVDNSDDDKVIFYQTSLRFDLEQFGFFKYDIDDNNNLENVSIPFNFDVEIDINTKSDNLCVLSHDRLIVTNCESNKAYLYNKDFEMIKKIEKIDDKRFVPYAIATNDTDRIYISDCVYKMVLMTDLDFTFLMRIDSPEPRGLCFANNLLYVCEFDKHCINIFNSDLTFQSSYGLDFAPWYIQVIDNIACIRNFNDLSISFHQLPDFTLKYRYYNHNGSICIAYKKFYEFYYPTSTIYCYNCDGTINKRQRIELSEEKRVTESSEMVYFQDRFIMSSNVSNYLIMPNLHSDSDDNSDDVLMYSNRNEI